MPWIMLALALAVAAVAYQRGLARDGVTETGRLLLQIAPVMLPAFLLAGMASVLISPEGVAKWIGSEAGSRGLLLGTAAGAVTPGGPFVTFPLLAVLLKTGANVGAVVAYLTSWALLGVHRALAYEIPILGWRFVLCRIVASLVLPFAAGWIAQLVWSFIPQNG